MLGDRGLRFSGCWAAWEDQIKSLNSSDSDVNGGNKTFLATIIVLPLESRTLCSAAAYSSGAAWGFFTSSTFQQLPLASHPLTLAGYWVSVRCLFNIGKHGRKVFKMLTSLFCRRHLCLLQCIQFEGEAFTCKQSHLNLNIFAHAYNTGLQICSTCISSHQDTPFVCTSNPWYQPWLLMQGT